MFQFSIHSSIRDADRHIVNLANKDYQNKINNLFYVKIGNNTFKVVNYHIRLWGSKSTYFTNSILSYFKFKNKYISITCKKAYINSKHKNELKITEEFTSILRQAIAINHNYSNNI